MSMSQSHPIPFVFADPVPRGCGERSAGGVYVESGLGPGGRPLEDFLFDPPLPIPEGLDLVNKPQIWDDPVTGVPHLWVWVGKEYYPYLPDYLEECMPPQELVVTARGLIPIEEVQRGDEVLTDRGRFRPVLATMVRPYVGDLISVVTAYWHLPLRVTPEHPVLRAKVLRGRARRKLEGLDGEHVLERAYVPAGELQVGDYLCCPVRHEEQDIATITMFYLKEYTTTFRNAVRTPDLIARAQTLRAAERGMPRQEPLRRLLRNLSERDRWSFAEVREACADLYRHETGLVRALTRLCAKGLLRHVQRGEYSVTDEGRRIAALPSLTYDVLAQELGTSPNTAWRAIYPPLRRHPKAVEIPLSDDLMRVIGYYLAEGSVANPTQNGRRHYHAVVEFSFGRVDDWEEQQLAEDTATAVRGLGFSAGIRKKRGYWHVVAYSRYLAHWLAEQFGTGAHHKHIPAWVLALPSAKLRPLFDAYIAGDGHVRVGRGGHWEATTVSLQLAYAISQVAQRCGFRASVRHYGPYAWQQGSGGVYRVTCYDGDSIGTEVFSDGEYLYLPIRTVTRVGYAGVVHNLTVAEDESYCAGYHAVHNCRRFGASRKLNPNLDLSRLVPASRLMLAHPFALNAAWLDQRPPYRCGKLLRGHSLVRDEASLDDAGDDREHWGDGEAPSDDWRLPDEPVGPCLFKTYELIPTTAATEPDHPLVMEGRSWYSRVIGSTSYLYAPTGESPEGLQPGVFASLTITGFALITRADGSVHEGAERKLAAAELPYCVSEK